MADPIEAGRDTPNHEAYTAFYPSLRYWAGEALDLNSPEVAVRFRDLLSEQIFSYETSLLRLKICKDGRLMLQVHQFESEAEDLSGGAGTVKETIAWWSKYLNYLNCLYLLLDASAIEVAHISYFELSEITNRDAFRIYFKDGKWAHEIGAQGSIASVYQLDRLRFDPASFLGRPSVAKEVFDALFAKYSIATADPDLLRSLAEIAKSVSEYKIGNYSTSLVLAWFVCESTLVAKWADLLDSRNTESPDGSKRISSHRRQTLTGRDYPISVISNILELSDLLPFETFKDVDDVRGYRNKVVHRDKGFVCGMNHCSQAIKLALRLTLDGTGLEVRPNLGYQISGA